MKHNNTLCDTNEIYNHTFSSNHKSIFIAHGTRDAFLAHLYRSRGDPEHSYVFGFQCNITFRSKSTYVCGSCILQTIRYQLYLPDFP